MHVLVIDDEDFCHLLSTHLHRKGHDVTVTNDGIQGQRTARFRQPDVITLDYDMPAAKDLTIPSRLRGNAETSHKPVVILSGSLSDEIVAGASADGAHRVLSKLTLTEQALVEALDSATEDVLLDDQTTLFPGEQS